MVEGPNLSTKELSELSGLTFREIDYWTRNGYIEPVQAANGSGSRRRYSVTEALRVRVMARVRDQLTVGDRSGSWCVATAAAGVRRLKTSELTRPGAITIVLSATCSIFIDQDFSLTPSELSIVDPYSERAGS